MRRISLKTEDGKPTKLIHGDIVVFYRPQHCVFVVRDGRRIFFDTGSETSDTMPFLNLEMHQENIEAFMDFLSAASGLSYHIAERSYAPAYVLVE